LCCLVLRGRANGNMRSNNFYIKTKTLINPRRIDLLLNSVNHFSPHLASPQGEARWGLDGSMRSNNNFYIKTKNIDKPKAD